MLLPTPVPTANEAQSQAQKTPAIARVLPSLTDVAFLMPLMFIWIKLAGARTLLGDGDTGWHVKTGEWMLANHQFPYRDMFSFSKAGEPWFAWEWLWDVAFGWLHMNWGMPAVVLGSAAVVCVTSALLFRLIRRKCGNGFVAIAVTLLATGGCAIHWLARPHLFTLLFLAVTLHITERANEGRVKLLGWLVPLTLVWTNLHGGFFVVFLILACYIGGRLVDAAIEADSAQRRATLAGLKPWLTTFALCFAATFVNPYGWNLHRHIVDYITDPYQLQHITEFQSMNFHSPVSVYFEPLMIMGLLTVFLNLRRRRFAEVFLFLGWLHLALIAQRNLPLFAIAAAPAIGEGIMRLIEAARSAQLASWIRRTAEKFTTFTTDFDETDRLGRVHLASVMPLALIGLLLFAPPAGSEKFISTYDPNFYPEKALPLLMAPDVKHIFAEDEWGDYLVYHLYPKKGVFIDGRSDFYGDEFGERYLDVMNVQPGWQKTLDKYAIDTIVIAPRFALATTLKISRDWRVVYDDHITLVFRRNPVEPVSLVTSSEGNDRDRVITKLINRDRQITQPN